MKAGLSIKMMDLEGYKEADLCIYQRLIGKLMYLACDTKPDIIFAVGQLSKHNANSRKKHLQIAKRVVRYLKDTIDISLILGQKIVNCLPKKPSPYSLVSYADNNFAEDPKD